MPKLLAQNTLVLPYIPNMPIKFAFVVVSDKKTTKLFKISSINDAKNALRKFILNC